MFLKSHKGKMAALAAVFLFSVNLLAAKETPIENLYNYELKNGLELFVAENHTVPLAYIEIVVKGGGIGQTQGTQGLFHLYEHMMFKGNSKFKTSEEMQSALTELGVANWNGSTGTEYVNYYFTVPSSRLKDGLEFWNAAIRTPKMDKREFEAEKKVVLSEIEGDKNDPSMKAYNFVSEKLFPEEPWVRSPGGTSYVVQHATIKQLKQIQKDYYIPNNAALFVGGDVNPEEVYALVNQIYGSWKKGKNPWVTNTKRYTQSPLEKTEFYVMPYDKISPQFAQVNVMYRGPDAEYDREDTYAADLLLMASGDPDGYFCQTLVNNPDYAIPDASYCGLSYPTSRRLGILSCGAIMLAPEQYLAERVIDFVNNLPSTLTSILPEDSVMTDYIIQSVHQQLYNQNILEQETAAELLATTKFWWCCADASYYYSYEDNVKNAGAFEISMFLEKYIKDKNPLVIVYVNPEVYEQCKDYFEECNFGVIK